MTTLTKMKKEESDHSFLRYFSLISIPFLLVVAPLCGYFLGYWLDWQFNTDPYLTFLFLFFGIVAAIREVYRMIKEFGDYD